VSSKYSARDFPMRQWFAAAGVVAASWAGVATAAASTLVDPPVFSSQNGVLDIMMVAMPQPIPGISFTPPNTSAIIHPTGWVYQVCPRPASGLS